MLNFTTFLGFLLFCLSLVAYTRNWRGKRLYFILASSLLLLFLNQLLFHWLGADLPFSFGEMSAITIGSFLTIYLAVSSHKQEYQLLKEENELNRKIDKLGEGE